MDEPWFPPPITPHIRQVAEALTRAFLYGDDRPGPMRERGTRLLGSPWPWLTDLCLRLHFELGQGRPWQPEQHDEILALILAYPPFLAAFLGAAPPRVRGFFPLQPRMAPRPGALAGVALPALASTGELADWLELSPTQLDWFANPGGRRPQAPELGHYHYRWMQKRQGGARLIEAPKARLRALQRHILAEILNRVPVHPAAQGCVRGRSVLSNGALHTGAPLLLKLDLRDFFVSLPGARVHALFRTLGYPRETARYLTGLTTHGTPPGVLRQVPQEEYPSPEERRQRQAWARQFMERHLPQGAPTSPALANLCAYRLDLRLAGAAREAGAVYSRYVDDLVFSLPSHDPGRGRRILAMVQEIILEEGFTPHWRKTRILPASTRQSVTGLVVNQQLNLPRQEYERLKAILTNCRRHGPASQNREGRPDFRAHLQGRIAWFAQVHPPRGARLMALFAGIDWDGLRS